MGRPVCLLSHTHTCPLVDPGPKPHIGGPVSDAGQNFVRFNGIPLAVEGGNCICTGMPGNDTMASGSRMVRINGRGLMRVGDTTSHGGVMVTGVPTMQSD